MFRGFQKVGKRQSRKRGKNGHRPIGFALSRLLDPSPGDAVTKLNLKKVFTTCREKCCCTNGAPVGRLLDEGMRQERAMLAQAEFKSKAPFGNSHG